MRTGIISDIHGDLPSLLMAVEFLKQITVDAMLCAGDLVERGADDHGVLAIVREHNILCVQGNHDENAVRHSELVSHCDEDSLGESPLSLEAVTFLKELPLTRSFEFGSSRVLLAHATPTDNGAPVFQDSSCSNLSKKFKKDLARIDAEILIVGHTHFPFDIRYKDKRVLNPGSVCNLQSRDSHTCGVLDLSDQSLIVFDLKSGNPVDILCLELG